MQPDVDQTGIADDALVMSEQTITKALDAARARISRFEQARTELDSSIEAARQEEGLLIRLLHLRQTGVPSAEGHPPDQQIQDAKVVSRGARHGAVEAVIEELKASGRPLHISELMGLLRKRNVAIPGAGTQANLITHLRRDDRLVRPTRGMYGLAVWGLHNMQASTRHRRRKRSRTPRTGHEAAK